MDGVPHAARRLAHLLLAIVDSIADPRTLRAWSHEAGVSTSHLRAQCRLAGVNPKNALDFGRLLRAAKQMSAGQQIENILDFADYRTLKRLLGRAGFLALTHTNTEQFLQKQVLIRDQVIISEIRMLLIAHVATTE